MLWLTFLLLLLLWMGGFATRAFGDAIHILLIAAVVALVMNMLGYGAQRSLE